MSEIANMIAQAAYVEGEFLFAADDLANNKIDAERIQGETFERVTDGLTDNARKFDPDLAMYVPNGARPYGEQVAHNLGIVVARAVKLPGPDREIVIPSRVDKALIHSAERILIVEDVTSKFTSLCKLLGVLEDNGIDVEERVSGITAIWRRGTPKTERKLPPGINTRWLVSEPMPAMMTDKQKEKFRDRHGIVLAA